MVGIVVVGHGRLAEEMVQTLESVLGHTEGLEAVATSYDDTPDVMRERIEAAVRRVDHGLGVIIATDMLGDTPTNLSLAIARRTGAEVVAGVNMPILIKLTSARGEMDAPTLARFIQRYGQEHIFWATESSSERREAVATRPPDRSRRAP
jgi:PTS system mannose-specific IIA component